SGSPKSWTSSSGPMSSRMWRSIVRADVWSSMMTMFKARSPACGCCPSLAGLHTCWTLRRCRRKPWRSRVSVALPRSHVREQQHVADRSRIGEEHYQAVDAYAEPASRRQPDLQRPDVVGVVMHGLVVAAGLGL